MPNHTPPQLFLIDGYALIYRAFFAMISRPLRTTKGENTSAAWGVVNFLLRLREKYRPDYVAWVNDAGTSFREERYPEYKSTREKLDESLQADFDRAVERICRAARASSGSRSWPSPATRPTTSSAPWPRPGPPAGSARSSSRATRTSISSSVPASSLLNPGRGGPAAVDEVWVDESNAAERLGVPPSQVVDFLALVGDTSDNIPGVKGIGEKGAQKLLAEYGDLDTILARAAEVTAKRTREALLGAGRRGAAVEGARHHPARRARRAGCRRSGAAGAGSRRADPDPHRAGVLLAGAEDGSAGERWTVGQGTAERPGRRARQPPRHPSLRKSP